jgi:hypothetical protein
MPVFEPNVIIMVYCIRKKPEPECQTETLSCVRMWSGYQRRTQSRAEWRFRASIGIRGTSVSFVFLSFGCLGKAGGVFGFRGDGRGLGGTGVCVARVSYKILLSSQQVCLKYGVESD